MRFNKRRAVSRTILVLALVVFVAILAAVEEVSLNSRTSSVEIDLHVYEDNPVLQLDHFYPDTIVVPLGENITLAVQNLDDETRVFTLAQFNINVTIYSGATDRVSILASKVGNFTFISPITAPSVVSQGRKGPCLEGFFYVTNSTVSTTTSTGTGVAPTEAAAEAAAAGPIGSCPSTPLTAP